MCHQILKLDIYIALQETLLLSRSQHEISKTTNELKAILNASEFSIIAVDVDGTVKEFNKGAEVLLGYTAEELVGKGQ
jgi:PAS domain-containing protein